MKKIYRDLDESLDLGVHGRDDEPRGERKSSASSERGTRERDEPTMTASSAPSSSSNRQSMDISTQREPQQEDEGMRRNAEGYRGEKGQQQQKGDEEDRRTATRERTLYYPSPQRRSRRVPDVPMHVVCVDGSEGADKAVQYAVRNLPKSHRLVLAHGVQRWSPKGTGTRLMDEQAAEYKQMESEYLDYCNKSGRDCEMWHFNYATYSGFGEAVCRFARFNRAESVIMGRRGSITDMRRAFLGSASQAVLNQCVVPVSVISED